MICKNCNTEFDNKNRICPTCDTKLQAHSFFSALLKADEFLAALCLTAMVVIVIIQIILRNLNLQGVPGISGAEPLVRHLVLWVVFLGAGMTAKENNHIRIDFISKILPEKAGRVIDFIVYIFSIIVLGIMIYAASSFIKTEFESESIIPLLDIPVWTTQIIIPVGYIIIGIHIIIHAMKTITGKADKG